MSSEFTRRNLLRAGGGAVAAGSVLSAGTVLSACSFLSTDPASTNETKGPSVQAGLKESPMLAEQVKSGALPPLEQRLPKNPMVQPLVKEEGLFGGTLQLGGTDQEYPVIHDRARSGIVEWNLDCTLPQPGLAEKWEIEDDGRTYVFHLRDGLKWSDGEPFSTDDLMFVYEHCLKNETLNAAPPIWLASDGKLATFTKIDALTFKITFNSPNGLFLKYLCWPAQAISIIKPAHYLKPFHPDFTPVAELKKQAKDEGLADWPDLFAARDSLWQNPKRPSMGPWVITKPVDTKSANATATRNPYFWKTDQSGRQLPYVDKLSWTLGEPESQVLKAANGDFDFLSGVELGALPVLSENAEKNNFRLLRWGTDGAFVLLNLNQSIPDRGLRAIFADLNFRAGLSHAINRDEINQALLAGQGSIEHTCGVPGDEYWVEGMGRRFIEYDVAKANDYLDKAGLATRDSANMRLRPDGSKLQLTLTTFDWSVGIKGIDVYEFVRRYWRAVGIDVEIKTISQELWYDSVGHGEMAVMGYAGAGYKWDMDPLWYIPVLGLTYWAPRFGNWYQNPKDEYAEEPTGAFRELQLIWDKLQAEVDDAKRIALGRQILEMHDQNVWVIGTVRPPFNPIVVSQDVVNMPESVILSHRNGDEPSTAQLFFRNPDQH